MTTLFAFNLYAANPESVADEFAAPVPAGVHLLPVPPVVSPEYNWSRTFVLKGGKATITHEPNWVKMGEGFQTGSLTVEVGSSINGVKIGEHDLVLSKEMTYDVFVAALVASHVYEDKPGNWFGQFRCKDDIVITHTPQGVFLQQDGQINGFKFLTLNGNHDHTLAGPLPFDVFVGMLEAAGYYKHED